MVAIALLVAAVAWCAVACRPPDPAADAGQRDAEVLDSAPLSGDIAFPRTLQAERMVELQVTLDEEVDAIVVRASLESPLFTETGWQDAHVRVFAGWPTRVRLPLGDPVCGVAEGSGGETPDAVAHVVFDVAGAQVEREVDVPAGVLAEIRAEECGAKALSDVASPRFGDVEAVAGLTVTTSLSLTRGEGDARVEAVRVAGSVVFSIVPSDPVLALEPGQDVVSVPVSLTPTRCDPHVFAESKKTFVFGVWLAVDGAEPRRVDVLPGEALKAALQDAFDRCASV